MKRSASSVMLSATLALPLLPTCAGALTPPAAARDAEVAVRIDGWPVTPRVLDVLRHAGAARNAPAEAATVTQQVIEDRVVGVYARRTRGDRRLFDDALDTTEWAAGVEDALVAILLAAYRDPLVKSLGDGSAERFVVRRHPLDPAQLQRQLDARGGLRLNDRLGHEQERGLDGVALLDYRLDDGTPGTITLRDVWAHLHALERHALYRGDVGEAMRHATLLVEGRVIIHWVLTHGKLTHAEMRQLRQLLADRDRREALQRQMGAVPGDHVVSRELVRLQRAVTAQAVQAYYDTHREQFQRIERVRAAHIRCADERRAVAASDELAAGAPFADVARRYSIAPSKTEVGSLGWIDAAQARRDWLAQLFFTQTPGPASAPVREPSTSDDTEPAWQIVKVEEREMGYHPAQSETAHFIASEAIARQRAAMRYARLRDRLVRAAHIDVNATLAGFAERAPGRQEGRR